MKIYHNPRCSKSRETLRILQEHALKLEIIEYLNNVPTYQELFSIIQYLEITPIKLVRRNELIWKEKFKNKSLSDREIIRAMVEFPKLIQRPIVVKGMKAILGRPPENVLKLIS